MNEAVVFTLNGKEVRIEGPPAMPLLFALRGQLDHKGTRLGCGEGHCGACTVTLDGVPVTSCDLPISAIAGKNVGTVEGVLAADHPLAAALIRHQAGQCGYCLPGILTRAAALIDQGQCAEDIRNALDANLCRCGAHGRIMAAIQEVAS
ncbi:2Fe-2S iron-sulfur cluster-binding protein [uncultured Boseongicola sp.]|jgi:nicotinate dehydrogenase subunit A|uniref:(2Fe-2S)-binding protein n=1 Tax=uncultured Boseongicola sp. TaxID=1648499 RepID=UPI002615A836|nr:2Fe-2S iron-sulfur cluster-binding protein [uncultured Boseongicola sp.]